MRRFPQFSGLAPRAVVLLGVGVGALWANSTVGLPPDAIYGNCFPFGCAYSGEYQQVYTASQFSAPILITGLEFFNTQYNSGATAMNSGTWAISLSTTAVDWNTIGITYANNVGAGNTLVFNGNLSQNWAFGDTLTIALTNPFTYDPSKGNLLMDVNVRDTAATLGTGASDAGGDIFFDTNGFDGGRLDGNTIMGQDFCNCGPATDGFVDNGYGLVTGFQTSPVPEPSIFAPLGLLALIVGTLRKKKCLNDCYPHSSAYKKTTSWAWLF